MVCFRSSQIWVGLTDRLCLNREDTTQTKHVYYDVKDSNLGLWFIGPAHYVSSIHPNHLPANHFAYVKRKIKHKIIRVTLPAVAHRALFLRKKTLSEM